MSIYLFTFILLILTTVLSVFNGDIKLQLKRVDLNTFLASLEHIPGCMLQFFSGSQHSDQACLSFVTGD